MLENLTDAQRALADYMSELSEDAWCAGWMMNLEFELWRAMQSEPRECGRIVLSDAQVETLQRLSAGCGGWVVYDEDQGETWVDLAEWKRRFSVGPPTER
jgi:phage pi2 protein 07